MDTLHPPGWIGVDLDGTLAQYDEWVHHTHIGEPIAKMVMRIKSWREIGQEVRIFTARIHPLNTCVVYPAANTEFPAELFGDEAALEALEALEAIQAWSLLHLGEVLPVTNVKDYSMIEFWGDRAVRVEKNTGKRMG